MVAVACSTSQAPPTGLEVVIQPDGLSAPQDFDDIRLQVSEQVAGGAWKTVWDRDYVVGSAELMTFPATFGVGTGQSSGEEGLVSVTAFKGGSSGTPVVQRVAQVQLPTDRIATMWMVLASICKGQVVVTGAEAEPMSTCPSGQSCQPTGPNAGHCGSNVIQPSTLPTYLPGEALDASAGLLTDGPQADTAGEDAHDAAAASSTSGSGSSSSGSTSSTSGSSSGASSSSGGGSSGGYRVMGGIRSTAPSAASSGGIRLVAGGFELGPRICNAAGICVTGGIVP
jgi:hypothetical protein